MSDADTPAHIIIHMSRELFELRNKCPIQPVDGRMNPSEKGKGFSINGLVFED